MAKPTRKKITSQPTPVPPSPAAKKPAPVPEKTARSVASSPIKPVSAPASVPTKNPAGKPALIAEKTPAPAPKTPAVPAKLAVPKTTSAASKKGEAVVATPPVSPFSSGAVKPGTPVARKPRQPVTIGLATAKAPSRAAAPAKSKAAAKTTEPKKPASPHANRTDSPRRILLIASECTPLAQTGGLGDVVAGLSKALRQRGHDARIVMPLYSMIDRAKYGIVYNRSCCTHFGRNEELWVGIHDGMLDGEVPIWFVDYERYFGRPWLYDGSDEDAWRFGVLSKAAMQVCKDTGFIPHVMHLHDWMSAPTAVFLKTWDRLLSPLSATASVLTIHNIGYQGKFTPAALEFYGLGPEFFTPDKFEDFGHINLLKAGIQYADMITTVSPTYAREIRGPIGGMGMGLYLNDRADRVTGILNGVDTDTWNPQTDKYLPARFNSTDLAGKAACKRALQERFGLEVNPKIPIFAMISRFAPQKGFDLIRGALPQALRDMVIQTVALGAGDPVTEDFFRWLSSAFPGKANAHIGFSLDLAHLMEAGSDFFLMPSSYEPCGLNQMYSSLYGALPIVRATGGLDDTVDNYVEATGAGTGFKFWDISDRALFYTIGWAVSTWYDRPQHYAAMQRRGMEKDFSWDSSAHAYERVYEQAIAHRAALG